MNFGNQQSIFPKVEQTPTFFSQQPSAPIINRMQTSLAPPPPLTNRKTMFEIKNILNISDDVYVQKILKLNNIQKDQNGNYDFDTSVKLNQPGLKICYLILDKNNQNSVNTIISFINEYPDYETVIDTSPNNNSDEMPGLKRILKKSFENDIYDIVYKVEAPEKFPNCVKGIIDTIVSKKKANSLKTQTI